MSTPIPTTIPMIPCESSNVAAHGYDAESKTLAVQFKNGGLYHYHDVPAEIAQGLTEAKSIGKYLGETVRGQFKHTQVPTSA